MKKIKYILFITAVIIVASCDTGIDSILPSEFNYISFEKATASISEASTDPLKIKIIYSSQDVSQDVTVNYTYATPAEKPAQEGVDYSLPSGSGSVVIPAGQSEVEVTLLNVINDNLSKGSRSVIVNLEPLGDFILGKPDNREAKSVIVTIQEDDLFTFGYTSFEEVPTFDSLTSYPRPAGSVDILTNTQDINPSSQAPYVAFTSTGNELGFTASFLAASVSSIENERIGVYNNTVIEANPGTFTTSLIDGNQAYVSSDLDGFLTLTFDEIVGLNTGVTDPVLDIKLFFQTTSWETEDGIVVYFETVDGLGDPLLSIFDDDVEDLEGTWQEIRVPIPQDRLATGRLVVTMRNGANTEMIIIDSIAIKGIL